MKTLCVMVLATCVSAMGDALMSQGMRQVGDVSAMGLGAWRMLAMFRNPLVWLSICCSAAYFFLYSSALSWSELSLAQPMNALTFVFGAVLARVWLHEGVSPRRMLGIAVVIAGIVLISSEPISRAP